MKYYVIYGSDCDGWYIDSFSCSDTALSFISKISTDCSEVIVIKGEELVIEKTLKFKES